MLELHHVLVLNRPVNLDLTHKLLLGSALDQGLLADHLGCQYGRTLGRVKRLNFIALRKTTLAQEFTLQITPDLNFSVVLGDLFFDDSVDWGLVVGAAGTAGGCRQLLLIGLHGATNRRVHVHRLKYILRLLIFWI